MAIVFKKKLVATISTPVATTGKEVIKGLMRAAVAQRHAMRRMEAIPRLSRSAELDAIAAFKATKGVTVCPTVHLVASNHSSTGYAANTLMRDRMKAAGL